MVAIGLMSLCLCVNVCVYIYGRIYNCSIIDCSSGFLAASGYAVYAHHVSIEYFNPNFDGLKWVNKPTFKLVPWDHLWLLEHQQVWPRHPALPRLGGLGLSHRRWFLLPVVSVEAPLWTGGDVSPLLLSGWICKIKKKQKKLIRSWWEQLNLLFKTSRTIKPAFILFHILCLQNYQNPATTRSREEPVHHGSVHNIQDHLQDQNLLHFWAVLQVGHVRRVRHFLEVRQDVRVWKLGDVRTFLKIWTDHQVCGIKARVGVQQVDPVHVTEQQQQDRVIAVRQLQGWERALCEKLIYLSQPQQWKQRWIWD